MVARISVELNDSASLSLRRLPRKLRTEVRKALNSAGDSLRDRIRENLKISSKNFTGSLAKSFEIRKSARGRSTFKATISSDSPYARIQETGGTIRPRRKRRLTIPLTARARARKAKDFPGLFRPKGKNYLATKVGKRLRPQYALAKSVRLRGKRYIEKSFNQTTKVIDTTFGRALDIAIKGF